MRGGTSTSFFMLVSSFFCPSYRILLGINILRLMQFTGRLPAVYSVYSAYDNVTDDANKLKRRGRFLADSYQRPRPLHAPKTIKRFNRQRKLLVVKKIR